MFAARSRRAAAAALAGLAWLSACSRPPAPPAATPLPAPATLLVRLGADTVAVEQYTRTGTRMEGTLLTRLPFTRMARYAVELDAAGAPTAAEFSVRNGDDTPIANELQSLVVRYGADSVHLTGRRAAGDTTRAFVVRGEILPYASGSYALYELALVRLLAGGRDSAEFAVVPLVIGARSATPLAMRRTGGDSASINYFGNPLYLRHDGRGGILGLDGTATTFKVRAERVAHVDVAALARDWASRDRSSAIAGPASTRDTVRATVGSAQLWIDYGRPALRGRDVWTNGVLGDTLWRTGANAATQFRTSAALVIGGSPVPAGTYSLWTARTPAGYQLVINRQVGQWGTVYDSKRDLVRVPLRESSVAVPVERFTIAIQPQGRAGTLSLSWGTKQLSVPFSTR